MYGKSVLSETSLKKVFFLRPSFPFLKTLKFDLFKNPSNLLSSYLVL